MTTSPEATIRKRAARLRDLEAERAKLAEDLRAAQASGVSVPQLVEWTGLSRRTVFYMLKRAA